MVCPSEGAPPITFHTLKTMAIATNTHLEIQESMPTGGPEFLFSRLVDVDVLASSPINESDLELQDISPPLGSFFNTGGLSINNRLIDNPGINDAVQNGIDIDRVTGIDIDQSAYAQDYWSAAAAMDMFVQGSNAGMVGRFHWSDFAESGTAGNLYKAGGVAVVAYECTSKGMTVAQNNKGNQLKQTGEDYDLNGDGHSGDAPTGDGCDGEVSLLDSAWEAVKDWWNSKDGDGESDEENGSDPDDCFEKPWLNDQCFSVGTGSENHVQNFNDLSSQMQILDTGHQAHQNEFMEVNMFSSAYQQLTCMQDNFF